MDTVTLVLMLCGAALCCAGLAYATYLSFWGPINDRQTAKQRREKCPPGTSQGMRPQGPIAVSDSDVKVTQGYFRLKRATIAGAPAGGKLFYSMILPSHGRVSSVVVFHHGYGDNCDFLIVNPMRAYAHLFDAAVISFDMPGHGRSDGLFVHVPDWFEFVSAAEEFVEDFAKPKCIELKGADSDPPLPLIIQGVSMGGGVCATLAIQRPGACIDVKANCSASACTAAD